MLFDSNGVIRRYETAEDILRDFFELRMAYYGKRRLALIQVSLLGALNICCLSLISKKA